MLVYVYKFGMTALLMNNASGLNVCHIFNNLFHVIYLSFVFYRTAISV